MRETCRQGVYKFHEIYYASLRDDSGERAGLVIKVVNLPFFVTTGKAHLIAATSRNALRTSLQTFSTSLHYREMWYRGSAACSPAGRYFAVHTKMPVVS